MSDSEQQTAAAATPVAATPRVPSLQVLCVQALIVRDISSLAKTVDLFLTLQDTVFMGCTEPILVDYRSYMKKHLLDRFDVLQERLGDDKLREILPDEYESALKRQQERVAAERLLSNYRRGSEVAKPQVSGPREDGSVPYESLVAGVAWPAGVVASKREQHLSDEEFLRVFNMTKSAFAAEDKIKRERLKKKVNLW